MNLAYQRHLSDYEIIFFKSKIPVFLKPGCKINPDCRSFPPWLTCKRIGIHGINMIPSIIHDNNLRISSLTPGRNLPPNNLRSNLSIVGLEMISKTILIIFISFPYHALFSRMSFVIFPCLVVVYV